MGVALTTATALSSSLSAAMVAMTIFVVVPMTTTVKMVTFVTRTHTAVLKILVATTTTPCAQDLMSHAIFQVMTTASTVTEKSVQLDVVDWIIMATVLTNTQSVVMVEGNTSAAATVTLTVPTRSTQSATFRPMNARQSLERFSSTQSRSTLSLAMDVLQQMKVWLCTFLERRMENPLMVFPATQTRWTTQEAQTLVLVRLSLTEG